MDDNKELVDNRIVIMRRNKLFEWSVMQDPDSWDADITALKTTTGHEGDK